MNPDRDARNLAAVAPALIDPVVGIIGSVKEVARNPGGPQFFHYSATAANTSAFTRQENFFAGGGASSIRDIAVSKAIGESVERYCSAIYDVDELPLHSCDESDTPCVNPGQFALYQSWQYEQDGFPFVSFENDTPIRWAEGHDPLTGESWLVPAAMVYSPYYYYQGSGDSPICQNISTGLACHLSPYRSALSGFYEVIERDCFTLTWLAMCAPSQIRIETLDDRNYELIRRIQKAPCEINLFDITMDTGVPTILSTLRWVSDEAPALVVAASTDLSPSEATRKALEELVHTNRYSQQITSHSPPLDEDSEFRNIDSQATHLQFYCDPENLSAAEFLFSSRERKDFDEIKNLSSGIVKKDLIFILRRLRELGYQGLVTELTSEDVAGIGLSVTRSIIPGFHPLSMGHDLRPLGGKRLREVPQLMGYPGIGKDGLGNPYPHPYP